MVTLESLLKWKGLIWNVIEQKQNDYGLVDMGVSLEQSPFISFSSFVYGESASLFLVLWDLLFLKLY